MDDVVHIISPEEDEHDCSNGPTADNLNSFLDEESPNPVNGPICESAVPKSLSEYGERRRSHPAVRKGQTIDPKLGWSLVKRETILVNRRVRSYYQNLRQQEKHLEFFRSIQQLATSDPDVHLNGSLPSNVGEADHAVPSSALPSSSSLDRLSMLKSLSEEAMYQILLDRRYERNSILNQAYRTKRMASLMRENDEQRNAVRREQNEMV